MSAFSSHFANCFSVTVASLWGKLPGTDADLIAFVNLLITAILSTFFFVKQYRFAKIVREEERKLTEKQDDLQNRQIEIEQLASLHASFEASRAITDRLLQLNEVQLSHSKISLLEIQESAKPISEVTGPPEDVMALETLIYMKLNIFEGIATLISGEEKELLASVQKGGFDSNGWGNWVKSELKKPLISSVYKKSPDIWSARLKQLHEQAFSQTIVDPPARA